LAVILAAGIAVLWHRDPPADSALCSAGVCLRFDQLQAVISKGLDKTAPADSVLVAHYLSLADRGGADVRLDLGVPYRVKAWPRASIPPVLWTWRIALAYKWASGNNQHINQLELAAVVNTLRWLLRTSAYRCVRHLHLVDSQVVAGVVTRGRSSSRKLRPTLAQCAALQLVGDVYLITGYVNTDLNPADAPSRKPWLRLHGRKDALHGQDAGVRKPPPRMVAGASLKR